jgi:hypothetical protein
MVILLSKIKVETLIHKKSIDWTNAKDLEEFKVYFLSTKIQVLILYLLIQKVFQGRLLIELVGSIMILQCEQRYQFFQILSLLMAGSEEVNMGN